VVGDELLDVTGAAHAAGPGLANAVEHPVRVVELGARGRALTKPLNLLNNVPSQNYVLFQRMENDWLWRGGGQTVTEKNRHNDKAETSWTLDLGAGYHSWFISGTRVIR